MAISNSNSSGSSCEMGQAELLASAGDDEPVASSDPHREALARLIAEEPDYPQEWKALPVRFRSYSGGLRLCRMSFETGSRAFTLELSTADALELASFVLANLQMRLKDQPDKSGETPSVRPVQAPGGTLG